MKIGQYVSKPYYEKMYSRIPCITAQNTAEYMYPAFKINKDFEWVCWKLWLQKMATQIWQNANLKKMT